jgi:rhamnulokinase
MVGAVERAATWSGRRVRTINVVGGGAQNAMLCQAIADRSALPVVAGPVEATAARTHDLTTYAPAAATEAVR